MRRTPDIWRFGSRPGSVCSLVAMKPADIRGSAAIKRCVDVSVDSGRTVVCGRIADELGQRRRVVAKRCGELLRRQTEPDCGEAQQIIRERAEPLEPVERKLLLPRQYVARHPLVRPVQLQVVRPVSLVAGRVLTPHIDLFTDVAPIVRELCANRFPTAELRRRRLVDQPILGFRQREEPAHHVEILVPQPFQADRREPSDTELRKKPEPVRHYPRVSMLLSSRKLCSSRSMKLTSPARSHTRGS
jgi:hypothetical protein